MKIACQSLPRLKLIMLRLPKISGQEANRALERLGFVQVKQKGSHAVLKKQTPDGPVGCRVGFH